MTGNPLFVSTTQNDFRLQPQSPALDTGSPMDAPTQDFADTLRPVDGDQYGNADVDIGAYEFTPVEQ